jgi:hypothetical protein
MCMCIEGGDHKCKFRGVWGHGVGVLQRNSSLGGSFTAYTLPEATSSSRSRASAAGGVDAGAGVDA